MVKASARAVARSHVRDILAGTADFDGHGLLLRGLEFSPRARTNLEPHAVDALLRLARIAESSATTLRDHPEQRVRRSSALLAAGAHPLLAALRD